MDSYQAVYDATKQSLRNCDVGEAVASVFRSIDVSFYFDRIANSAMENAAEIKDEQTRPCVLFKPVLTIDGNQYCASYGADPMQGVFAYGDTPNIAMRNFDEAWKKQNPPTQAEQ